MASLEIVLHSIKATHLFSELQDFELLLTGNSANGNLISNSEDHNKADICLIVPHVKKPKLQAALLAKLASVLSDEYSREYTAKLNLSNAFGQPTIRLVAKQSGLRVFLMLN